MNHIGKILVPVDLAVRSVGAAKYADALARAFKSELVFVHALRNGWPLCPTARNVRSVIMEIQRNTPGRFVIREGEPVPVILETAKAEKADLILMATRGVPPISRLLDRSITAQVLRAAECPVWSGIHDLATLINKPIRTILCGLSLGPRTEFVLRWAGALARRLNATLALIHAGKDFESMPWYPCDGEWRLWRKGLARAQVRAIQENAGTDAGLWIAPGRTVSAVPTAAHKLRADLLVIGKSPQRRILGDLRTMSYELVCRTPCPVASV